MGSPISNGGAGHHCPPLATALIVSRLGSAHRTSPRETFSPGTHLHTTHPVHFILSVIIPHYYAEQNYIAVVAANHPCSLGPASSLAAHPQETSPTLNRFLLETRSHVQLIFTWRPRTTSFSAYSQSSFGRVVIVQRPSTHFANVILCGGKLLKNVFEFHTIKEYTKAYVKDYRYRENWQWVLNAKLAGNMNFWEKRLSVVDILASGV